MTTPKVTQISAGTAHPAIRLTPAQQHAAIRCTPLHSGGRS